MFVTGIAQVMNVRLNPNSFNSLLWDHAPGSGLMYRVILTNTMTGQLIVNDTTSTTSLSLPTPLQLCQYYTANVTAFTAELHSDTVVTELRVPGGEWVCHAINVMQPCLLAHTEYYNLDILSSKVVVFNTTHCTVTFTIDIQEVRNCTCILLQIAIFISSVFYCSEVFLPVLSKKYYLKFIQCPIFLTRLHTLKLLLHNLA